MVGKSWESSIDCVGNIFTRTHYKFSTKAIFWFWAPTPYLTWKLILVLVLMSIRISNPSLILSYIESCLTMAWCRKFRFHNLWYRFEYPLPISILSPFKLAFSLSSTFSLSKIGFWHGFLMGNPFKIKRSHYGLILNLIQSIHAFHILCYILASNMLCYVYPLLYSNFFYFYNHRLVNKMSKFPQLSKEQIYFKLNEAPNTFSLSNLTLKFILYSWICFFYY